MTTHSHARREILEELKSCKSDDFECRMEAIMRRGTDGMKNLLTVNLHAPDPGSHVPPSAIREIVDLFVKTIAELSPFKQVTKPFKYLYQPHFEILEIAHEAYNKYWDVFEFLDWINAANEDISELLRDYIQLLRKFSVKMASDYLFTDLDEANYQRRNQQYLELTFILRSMTVKLTHDVDELFGVYIAGLKAASQIDAASSIIDQIALMKRLEALRWDNTKYRTSLATICNHLATMQNGSDFERLFMKNVQTNINDVAAKRSTILELIELVIRRFESTIKGASN